MKMHSLLFLTLIAVTLPRFNRNDWGPIEYLSGKDHYSYQTTDGLVYTDLPRDVAQYMQYVNMQSRPRPMAIPVSTLLISPTALVAATWHDCLPNQAHFATGCYLGWHIEGGVDSETAKYLVKNHLSADSLFEWYDGEVLSTNLLRRVQQDHSHDVSVLYFLRRSNLNNPEERRLYDSLLNDGVTDLEMLKQYTVAFIPGLGYKSDTTTGADFARQRRLFARHGIKNVLVEIEEWGLIEQNASIIRETLENLRDRPLILVSASKGGLETMLALDSLPAENVKAWVSIGGILHGTPIADQYLTWPKSLLASALLLFEGGSHAMIEDMSYAKRNPAFRPPDLASHIKVVHYVGVPLAYQVSSEVEGRFCDLLEYGPNDGLTPVADQLLPNGIIIAEPGLDHYYRAPDIDARTLALASMVASILERR